MGANPPPQAPTLTADDLFRFMIQHDINDDKIFNILCASLDKSEYKRLLSRIDKVNSREKPAGKPRPSWEGKKNRIKGKLFEKLVGVVLSSVEPFTSWNNVHTSTSEIDWVVQIGPSGGVIPSLREWGTHFLCECKFSNDHISIQWVTNLNTVLQTHGTQVGLLFCTRGVTNRGNGARVVRQIQMLSVMTPARFIVCLNSDDMHVCATGFNFLRLISQRYMEAKANTGRLRLLRN
jgi:hypothetical protein